ncbi:MAG: sugar phosphate isomerase/epimerase family protein [Candidatus Brachytrichaceae bacterium NZ_4S206]
MSSLHFAYSTINWGEWCDLNAAFSDIRAAGWHAVELFNHALDWLGPPRRLRDWLGDLQVATFFGAIELPASERALTVHKRRIDYAAEMGAQAYGLVGATRPRTHPPTRDDIRALAHACESLAEYAAEAGLCVAYHPHTRCTVENEAEIDALMNETRALRLCLDVSHIALVGEDPLAHLRKYRERLGYVHLKDWARGEFVEMGEGTLGIDFAACLKELESQGFAGWCVVEHSVSKTLPLDSAKANALYLRSLGYSI